MGSNLSLRLSFLLPISPESKKCYALYENFLFLRKPFVCNKKKISFLLLHTAPILSILTSSIPEVVFVTLRNISVLIKTKPRLFHDDFKFFFLRWVNSPYFSVEDYIRVRWNSSMRILEYFFSFNTWSVPRIKLKQLVRTLSIVSLHPYILFSWLLRYDTNFVSFSWFFLDLKQINTATT